ncbi:unnamed protein product [Paramecium pentaurelia]|uniref:Alpha-type protein kinase domain-containing protein n=1 Tax=Paramecium pentaurelia TaxID=43138 RepID=A0A8S1SLD2_9CILI|nr:unnamed protein product [Paramecium pentaurelia]
MENCQIEDNSKSNYNQLNYNPFNNPNNFPPYPNQMNMFPNLQNFMNNNIASLGMPPTTIQMIPPFTIQRLPSLLHTTILNKSQKEKQLQQQINDLEELLQDQEEKFQEQIKGYKKSSQLSCHLKCIIQDLEDDIFDQNKLIQTLQSDNENKQLRIDKITKEKSFFESQINDLQEEVGQLMRQNQQLIRKSVAASSFDQQLIQEYDQQVKKSKEEVKKLKDDNNKQKLLFEDQLESVEKELDKQIKLADKEHQYFMEARDEITKLQKVIKQKEEKIKYQEFQQMNFVDTLRQANKQKQQFEDQLQSVEKELDKQINQADKEHQYFLEARDEITKLQKVTKYQEFQSRDEITKLQKVIKQQEFQQINFVDTLRQVNMDKQKLEDKIKYKDFEINSMNDQIKLLQNQVNFLKDLIKDSQNGKQIKLDQNNQYKQLEQQMLWLNEKRNEDKQKIELEIQQNELIRKEKLVKERKKIEDMQKQAEINKEIHRENQGAIEALCKQGNFYKFEEQPNVKTVNTKFEVWRVEIKDEEFNKNIETIERIQCPQDFSKFKEGTWNCLRTEIPFAFSMMKDIFLMKKLNVNSDELYVIKTPIGSQPYKTMNDALMECKSHLICQKLMKKFITELQEQAIEKKKNIKIPSVIYNDLLILEESQNSFWIAERFFKGDFVKYNNNYGYINEDYKKELNKFAQSFTYYTYFISNFNYMVTDIQGVGNYFTDPTINTHKGDFDETDMGEEGQMMYLVNYDNKKALLTYDYLDLLGIYD